MEGSAPGLIEAARAAIERGEWANALQFLRDADDSHPLSARDLEDLAQSAWWMGLPDECIGARERAFGLYSKTGDDLGAARVAMALAEDHFHKRAPAIGRAWLKRAEGLLKERTTTVEFGYLLRTKAVIAFEADNDLESALSLATRAHGVGSEVGDPDLKALTLHDVGRAMVASGNVDEGMALLDEAMVAAVAGELGMLATGRIYCNMVDICEQLADYRRARDWTEAARRWCDRAGSDSVFPGVCRVHRAEIMRLSGDWTAAETEARRACDDLSNFADFAGEAFYEIGQIRLHMGDYEGARQAFRLAHGSGKTPQPGLALLHLAEGDIDGAWSLIDQSVRSATAPLKKARLLVPHVEIALAAGLLDDAESSANELERLAGEYGSPTLEAQAARCRGALLVAREEFTAASGHLERAIRELRESDLPYETAKTRMMLGKAYRMSGLHDLAELEFSAARDIFTGLGAAPDLRGALQALQGGTDGEGKAIRVQATLMFTDIVGSTPLVAAIGDEAWGRLRQWHDKTLRTSFARHGGREIDNAGDGFFVAFESPRAAVDCAVEIQEMLNEQRRSHGFAPEVRIGLHSGIGIMAEDRLMGEEIHRAARIGGQAVGGEILVTAAVIEGLDSTYRTEHPRLVTLKGFPEQLEVASIVWA